MAKLKYIFRILKGVKFERINKTLDYVKEKCGHGKVRTFIDLLWCAVRYGAGHFDYITFGFYNMKGSQRDTYVTRVRNKKIIEKMNDPAYSDIFDDKLLFNERFADFLMRDTVNADAAGEEEFASFMQKHEAFLAKPKRGTCSKGIEMLHAKDFDSAKALKEYCHEKDLNVLEEILQQHEGFSKLHKESVNCLRIVTDRVGDEVHVAYVTLKVGAGGSFSDDGTLGGVMCRVDAESGKICTVATDESYHIHEKHPTTGVEFKGYQLPYVKESIEFAKKAAMVVPEIGHVGWDIAVTPEGPAMIEGNDYPGIGLSQQEPFYPEKHGLWPYYKKILKL